MGQHGNPAKTEEAEQAHREALRGAVSGGARWGLYMIAFSAAAHLFSPIYRNLTVGFKVYIFMSGITIGSMVEADHRLRDYEKRVRQRKRSMLEARQRWEEEHDS